MASDYFRLALPCGVARYLASYSFCLALRCGVALFSFSQAM